MHTIQSSHRSVPGEIDVVVSWLLQRLAANLAEINIAYQNGWSTDGSTCAAAARCPRARSTPLRNLLLVRPHLRSTGFASQFASDRWV
jgi:hypothetical protein